jgi:hypothetical protein
MFVPPWTNDDFPRTFSDAYARLLSRPCGLLDEMVLGQNRLHFRAGQELDERPGQIA